MSSFPKKELERVASLLSGEDPPSFADLVDIPDLLRQAIGWADVVEGATVAVRTLGVPTYLVADDEWQSVEDGACLLATIVVNGVELHLEAIEVRVEGSLQVGVEGVSDTYERWRTAADNDGHFQTVEIKGRHYALFASPYSQ